MKKIFAFAILMFVLIACSEDNSTAYQLEEGDMTVSTEQVDFSFNETSKQISVNLKTGKKLKWTVRKSLTNRWLSLDAEGGTESRKINLTVNRDFIPSGKTIDTLHFVGIIESINIKDEVTLQKIEEVSKKIVVTIDKIKTYSDVLMETIGNEAIVLQSYSDSSYSVMGSFMIEKGSVLKTSFAGFYSAKQFVDAGTDVTFKAKTGENPLLNIALQKNTFSYTAPDSSSYSAIYYIPQGKAYPNGKSDFDDVTYHKYTVPGGAVFKTAFADSVLSVSMPAWKNPAITVTKTSDLIVQWIKTAQEGDSVAVVLYSKSDTSVKITATLPVRDDIEILTIPKDKIEKLSKAGTECVLWLIRYRVKRDNTNKRYLISQAQNYYSFKIN